MSDRPLSVLYVTARFPPFVGGTEIHVAEVSRRMAARGHSVTVLTTALGKMMSGEETVGDVRVIRVRARPARWDMYFAPAVFRKVRAGHWDVVHIQGYHTLVAPLAMIAALTRHQPYVVTFHSGGHSSVVRRLMRPVQRRLLRPLLKRAKLLIGVSEDETEFFRRTLRLGPERFTTISNGVADEFHEAPRSSNESTLLASVGRLEKFKNHHHVIRAMPQLAETFPDVELAVVGTGPHEAALRRMTLELGMQHRVRFIALPPEDREGMAKILGRARLAVNISEYESQGMAALEAIAAGCAVLVSANSPISRMAGNGGIFLAPPQHDDAELADLITAALRLGDEPVRTIVPRWDNTVDALEECYRAAIG